MITRTNARLTHALLAGKDQNGDNYLNDDHLPPETSRTQGQSATGQSAAMPSMHYTQITRAAILCHNGHV